MMDKLHLEQKWKGLLPDGPGYKSLRIDSSCIPDMFIGIYNVTTRCLILQLPQNYKGGFQSVEKENLSLEFFRETKWIIMKLLDDRFTDLFDDLIVSIYSRIHTMTDPVEYSKELINTFYKWSEFFNERATLRLPEESLQGIFGELLVLKDHIDNTDAMSLNDILNAWKGPYNNRHDIVFPQKDLEVKTIEDSMLDISISSEFQLDNESGKELELIIARILRDPSGISLYDLVMNVRQLVISKMADFSIILRGLSAYGLNLRTLREYDDFRYLPVSLTLYDCTDPDFPRIIPAGIPAAISKVNYQLKVTALNKFLLSSKNL